MQKKMRRTSRMRNIQDLFLRQYSVWGQMRGSGVGGKETKYLFIFSTSLCFIPLGSGC